MKLKKNLLKLNLQFFAEPNPGEPNPGEPGDEKPTTFSQDEVNEIISKRLKKEQAKWERDFKTKLEEEKKEAERLANLNAEQRKEEEYQKRLKEVEEREKTLRLQEERVEAIQILNDRGLSPDFVDFLMANDSQTTLDNINNFEKAFKEALKVEISKRLPSGTPSSGGAGANGGNNGFSMTKEEYSKLSLSEKNKLFIQYPDEVKELLKK